MLNLLVVEDQPAVREVVSEIVGEMDSNIRITQAANLAEARSLLTSGGWDGLITDMSLGDGNVLELISVLKKEGVRIPPTILMSGFLTSERMAHALEMGIEHVLAKPFAPDVLLGFLKKMFMEDENIEVHEAKTELRSSDRLLPEMFEMDRRLGILNRMFDEIPVQKDVASMCSKALNLAVDIVHAKRGFLALFERSQQTMVVVANQGVDNLGSSCAVGDTHFQSLLSGDEQLIQFHLDDLQGSCWRGLEEVNYIAIPVSLQHVPVGVICLLDPLSEGEMKSETKQVLGLLLKELDTQLDNCAVHAALSDNMRETLIALVRSLEARDRYTRDHSDRVGHLSASLATMMGLEQDHIELIRTGGLLHDIGKCGIPDAVLLKPGRYTDGEFAIMKAHPVIGDNILKNMDAMARERLMIRHHHERFDGLGYPDRLAGDVIPLEARIVCVADAIDAMTTHRVYRMAKSLPFCLEQLKLGAGTQFDPRVVEAALAVIDAGGVHTQADDQTSDKNVLPLSALVTSTARNSLFHSE